MLLDLPHSCRSVATARGHQRPISIERDGVDGDFVTNVGPQQVARLGIPDFQLAVMATRRKL